MNDELFLLPRSAFILHPYAFHGLHQKSQVRCRKATDERKHCGDLCACQAEPRRERCAVLLDGGRRNPSPARAGACGLERAPEIRERKRRHLLGQPLRDRLVIEGFQCLADLRQQSALPANLSAVMIEAAERAEEDLPLETERGLRLISFDEPRDLLQLIPQRRVRKDGRHFKRRGIAERLTGGQRLRRHVAHSLYQTMLGIERTYLIEGAATSIR